MEKNLKQAGEEKVQSAAAASHDQELEELKRRQREAAKKHRKQ